MTPSPTARALALALLLVCPVLAGSCRPGPAGEDRREPSAEALQSLREPTYSPTYGLEYWTRRLEQRHERPDWDRARAFCRDRDPADHPNCRTIHLLQAVSRIPGFARQETAP